MKCFTFWQGCDSGKMLEVEKLGNLKKKKLGERTDHRNKAGWSGSVRGTFKVTD